MQTNKSLYRNFRYGYLFFLAFSLILFISFSVSNFRNCHDALTEQYMSRYISLEDSLNQIENKCTVSLRSIGHSTYTQNWLFEHPNNSNYTYRNFALYNMNNSYRSLDYCRDEYLYTSEGKILCLNSSTTALFYQMLEDNNLKSANLKEAFFSDIYYIGVENTPCIFFVMPLKNIYSSNPDQKLIGAVLLDMNEWMNALETTHQFLTDSSGMLLVEYKNNFLTHDQFNEHELLTIKNAEPYSTIRLDTGNWLVNSSELRLKHWKFTYLYPEHLFLMDVLRNMQFFFLYALLFFTIFHLFAFFALHMFRKAISTISGHVNEISGFQKIPANGEPVYKELLPLYTAVNVLIERLENAAAKEQQLYQAIIEQKKAELIALKSQINAHFLFNTLSSMNNIAIIQKNQEISDLICDLSGIFQYLIFTPSVTDLSSEMEMIKHYHAIMNYRFPGKHLYQYDISDDAECWYVPTMFLMPLVENAGRHGKNIDQKVTVSVSAYTQNDFLIVKITDDAIQKPRIEISNYINGQCYKENPKISDDKELVSLRNVCNRLYMLFGDMFSIQYISSGCNHTSLILKIPQMTDEIIDFLINEKSNDSMTL